MMFANLTKTQKYLIMAILAVVVYGISAAASYSMFAGKNGNLASSLTGAQPTPAANQDEPADQPRSEACPLNGSMHTKIAKQAWDKRRPLAVMIENHIEARPQSGLSSADVVYEAVAEGGITRFMALYLCTYPDVQVGPVRSARTYFLDWLSEYDALYAHVGGANSPGPANALGQIIDYGIKDLNQFSIGFPTFWRDYQRLGHEVATEHTMYSTVQKLWAVGQQRGWGPTDEHGKNWAESFTPWKFADGKPAGQTGKITVNFWEGYKDYQVEWNFDASCNCYKRKNGDALHVDFNNKKQLSPQNVVVQFEAESHANDGYEGNVHLLYGTKGRGDALIFQNGTVVKGQWIKPTRLAREKFIDSNGQEINFVRGQIWIETVPIGSKVIY